VDGTSVNICQTVCVSPGEYSFDRRKPALFDGHCSLRDLRYIVEARGRMWWVAHVTNKCQLFPRIGGPASIRSAGLAVLWSTVSEIQMREPA